MYDFLDRLVNIALPRVKETLEVLALQVLMVEEIML